MCETLRKTQPIQPSKVNNGLETKIFGSCLHCFRELTSTNDMAKELAVRGSREGTVIVSETQTSGKGRLRRKWISPEGGIWLSIIMRPNAEPKHAPKLTLMASVVVAKTINKLSPLRAEIKWPNDVLINHRKVCGILSEAKTKDGALEFIIVGIGINANFNLNALPIYLRDSSTTLKEELRKEIDREGFLRTLLEETEFYYGLFKKGEFDFILTEWRNLARFLGSYVEVVSQKEKIEGWATDIDEDGALIVKPKDLTIRNVMSGDLAIIKVSKQIIQGKCC